ncbi:MAG: DNA-protecting protein DprA [Gammaproteobacteria bacterium]|nr:DNA-protecting protein DprA [Gammaproteobacteria bacterium]
MNRKHLASWLHFVSIEGVGWSTASKLLDHFQTPEAIFEASKDSLKNIGASQKLIDALANRADITSYLDKLWSWLDESENNFVVTPMDSDYPSLLKQISSAPLILYGTGHRVLLNSPQLAIVGTRNPTPQGKQITADFAATIAKRGVTITSGMALGIDGVAHQACLTAKGNTIAVAGTGLDRVYPARHKSLAHAIQNEGLLLSEYALGTQVRGSNFPRRNRIIAGMSLGVLVVEAAIKSGSLITAQYALEQSREVFAIPGSIHNVLAKGCHQLIKEGAHLVESADEILNELGFLASAQSELNQYGESARQEIEDLEESERELLHNIDFSPLPIDDLVERCKKSVADLSPILLTLELKGLISSVAGGYQRQR